MIIGYNTTRKIEKNLALYKDIKKAIALAREEQLTAGGHSGGGASTHAFVSDPTASTAMKLAEPLKCVYVGGWRVDQPEAWVKAIDRVFADMGQRLEAQAARRRYIHGEKPEFTMDNMQISRQTYYNWRENFVHLVGIYAAAAGLLNPSEIVN